MNAQNTHQPNRFDKHKTVAFCIAFQMKFTISFYSFYKNKSFSKRNTHIPCEIHSLYLSLYRMYNFPYVHSNIELLRNDDAQDQKAKHRDEVGFNK